MLHDTPLITTIVAGLCLAFLLGMVASRLRISPLVGYLLAGVLVGPNTGGFRIDSSIINQLAEIGVILLMFGVGLHFSLKDLLSVKAIAIPAALAQMAFSTFLGLCLGLIMGWGFSSSLVFGLALSTASTVILLRALQERHLIETEKGRIAVGWLIIEDLAMVLILVLIPSLANILGNTKKEAIDPVIKWLDPSIWGVFGLTILKVIVFIILMLVIGRRIIPWLLKVSAQSGSRELFRLSVFATALGVAFGAAHLFGVSLSLGAFFAGMVMSESELSHRAAEESLPLRDAFSVLFFVSVGMLFDPGKILSHFFPLLATLLIIIIGKSAVAFFIVKALRHSNAIACTISASLAQIGEFSFILASLSLNLGFLNNDAHDLILGGAILSILLNPLVFIAFDKIKKHLENLLTNLQDVQTIIDIDLKDPDQEFLPITSKTNHIVIIGYGRIGKCVALSLINKGELVVIVEESKRLADKAIADGLEVICGNIIKQDIMSAANISNAYKVVITMRSTIEVGECIVNIRNMKKDIQIITHALSDVETAYLIDLGADIVVTDDEEIANGIIEYITGQKSVKNMHNYELNLQKT
ncbi:YbaL family putative K(+) efflux transporter [Bartonella quintana]|uniref:Potassium-efflux system protein n=1 Tax=Bartonella quintana (strain Toulouse) TaxID=283165 RepID=A0A0H3M0T6_BARQU|nr:YbaL family putative K(+) efflux transporter [Bartonella quintana]KEC59206.1 monovalent cation:proton antiporter-2 (CPA2) family transporter [Bartonella quintana JK 19]KEC68988.1 monovalent cation:proton antiporter-2 (CPA2) family transporter [Bartonella quintana JK 39]QUG72039.1 Kef family K(+) transporter [Bartonella quintana]CAF26329.1 Potassium-efflux system protein [Bartonella quintana str. Toulouse]